MDEYKRLTGLLRALAHPVRFQILDILSAEGASCPCHLESRLGKRQAYISQQLTRLREIGLVEYQREGNFIYYYLSDGSLETLLHAAKDLTLALLHRREGEVAFPLGQPSQEAQCNCPKCNQN